MIATSIKYRGHRCFKNEWAGFDEIKPINVIIGRNNTGKSHLLDLVQQLCEPSPFRKGWEAQCKGILDEWSLKTKFQSNVGGGDLVGNHWNNNGVHLIDAEIGWELVDITLPLSPKLWFCKKPWSEGRFPDASIERLKDLVPSATHFLTGHKYRHLLAERNLCPEQSYNDLRLSPNGDGATNIIRRYYLTANPDYPRELITVELLHALNQIFGADGSFLEISVRHHDDPPNDNSHKQNDYEIFLIEENKGSIPLSRSGSGLKTVILVLLNLLVVPKLEKQDKSKYVFAFEELENNLHPALLRRLYKYIENYSLVEKASIFLTTHSSVALDFFGSSKNAQIIRVEHDGTSAKVTPVNAHFDRLGIISELGAKPSDLLQANGIIWVEGPSDRIYLNRWIDIFSNGALQEGRDYQCAFYGGSLLARLEATPPETADAEFVNLIRINPNIAVICDGDRTAATGDGSELKARVQRIRGEVDAIPGAQIWITDAKEIESYVPGSIFAKVFSLETVPDPGQYEVIFPSESAAKAGTSFVENSLKRKSVDKIELAIEAAPLMTKDLMETRFDLAAQIEKIIEKIKKWNS